MEYKTPKTIELDEIPENILSNFQISITPQKIYDFFEQSIFINELKKSKEIHKLTKSNFILICNNIFSKEENNNTYINIIYDLIFERLKIKKCVFKLNGPSSTRNYILSDIISTEKIDIQTTQLFFSALMLKNFKEKIETMFHVIDSDNDGSINENEIKKLIITTNKLFNESPKGHFSKSNLVQQALSNFKANKILVQLFYGEPNLKNILKEKRIINFEEFYECLKKIDNYMYDIIPTFINLKNYLTNKKEEIEFYMSDNCQKDFADISYELIRENKMLNIVNPKNTIKQLFDKEKMKYIKIDPLKDLKEMKRKVKEMKWKNLIEFKKKKYGYKYNKFLHNSISNSNLNSPSIKNKRSISNKIIDDFKFNYETPSIKTKSTNQNNKDEEEKYKNTKTDKNLTKINTAEFHEKLNLYSKNETEKNTEKKYPHSFPLLKESRKKELLKKIFGMEVSPFEIIESKPKNKIINPKKIISFFREKENMNLITKRINNTTSDNNLETNFSTFRIGSRELSSKNDNYLNFKKISILNKKKSDNLRAKEQISKTYVKKRKELFDQLTPNFSLVRTSYRKSIPYFYSMSFNNNKKSKEQKIELGDYTNFDSILFPPCIVRTKEKTNNSFYYSKEDFNNKTKTLKKKFKGIDFYKLLI